jgi:organic radical activating enzyme
MTNKINVSESFYSIQGEGKYSGTPSVFLRLQSCNLLCTWCDTLDVWRKGTAYDVEELYNDWLDKGFIARLYQYAHLVITGGEPTLRQNEIVNFMNVIKDNSPNKEWTPFTEMETNCTIKPDKLHKVQHFTCSPKLNNSGMRPEDAIKPEVIEWHVKRGSVFKFVVKNESDVIESISKYIEPFNIPNNKVWLMPESTSQYQLDSRAHEVVKLAMVHGFNYSDRLHIRLWNQLTGV